MKIVSWNVNGIRAADKKGFSDWLKASGADVVCLQETKARADQLDIFLREIAGYRSYWTSAEKAGYSGTAIYTKHEPEEVITGIGLDECDTEGRLTGVRMKDLVIFSAYFPNSQREHARLPCKLKFCKAIHAYCDAWVKKGYGVVLSGDYNIAHQEIDLKNPKTNRNNAGFLPAERAWMDHFLSHGYVDTFREFEKGPGHYTWWSHRPGVREKNIGWRIDYHCVNEELRARLKKAWISPEVLGSDHCPVWVELK